MVLSELEELVGGLSDLISSETLREEGMTHRNGYAGADGRTEPEHHPKSFHP